MYLGGIELVYLYWKIEAYTTDFPQSLIVPSTILKTTEYKMGEFIMPLSLSAKPLQN